MSSPKPLNIGFISLCGFFIWTVLVVVACGKDFAIENNKTLELARREALTTFNKDQAFRHWSTSHGGVYVPVTPKTLPNQYLSHVPDRDIVSPSGVNLTLMNPAYMLRQIMEEYHAFYGIKGRITSLKPLNPNNLPDDWERKALKVFEEKQIMEFFEIEHEGEQQFLRLMRPMVTVEGCLKCHAHQGYRVGDIRGGVGVKLPMAPYLSLEQISKRKSMLQYAMFWLGGSCTLFLLGFWGQKKIDALFQAQHDLAHANSELLKALAEVKTLRGIIPICVYCKKIKDEKGLWGQIEDYIHTHSGADFSHGACPECYKQQMDALDRENSAR